MGLFRLWLVFWVGIASSSFAAGEEPKWGRPAPNPFAAAGPYPMSHHNPGQTDLSVVEGPSVGKQLTRQDVKTVPVVWCSAPIVKRREGHTTVIAGTAHGLVKIDATGEAFDFVSMMPYPGLENEHTDITAKEIDWHRSKIDEKRRLKQDWRLLFHSAYMLLGLELNASNGGSGAYGVIDQDGFHYTFFGGTRILKSFDGNERGAPLRPVRDVGIADGFALAFGFRNRERQEGSIRWHSTKTLDS